MENQLSVLWSIATGISIAIAIILDVANKPSFIQTTLLIILILASLIAFIVKTFLAESRLKLERELEAAKEAARLEHERVREVGRRAREEAQL
jgi:uncharacterized membrane protein